MSRKPGFYSNMILGISAFWHDAAAALIDPSNVIAAAEEERFTRIKHDGSFPKRAIQFCLDSAQIDIEDITGVAYYREPNKNIVHQFLHFWHHFPRSVVAFYHQSDWIDEWYQMLWIRRHLKRHFPKLKAPFFPVSHPMAHAASCFFPSPFDRAAILVQDAMGEWASTSTFIGDRNQLKRIEQVGFPHSLGVFYQTITMFLGFTIRQDEYKVMGLSAYGKPRYLDQFREIIYPYGNTYRLNLRFFQFQYGLKPYWSSRLEEVLGGPRHFGEELTDHHADIACSLQRRLEEIGLHITQNLFQQTQTSNLCIAGGVGLNSVLNGVLLRNSPFTRLYVPSAAGDAGASLGAALYVNHCIQGHQHRMPLQRADLGPQFPDEDIELVLQKNECQYHRSENIAVDCARRLAEGQIIGWFQGRMEWGPRALGQRSILADPRRSEMKDIINQRIKGRESFRPFAPSVLESHVDEYFITNGDPSPFMTTVYQVKEAKQSLIPAVVHVDQTARIQTVSVQNLPLYAKLITEFFNITGIPLILNTSFNDNGVPIVCTPQDAIDVFRRIDLDVLAIGHFLIEKIPS